MGVVAPELGARGGGFLIGAKAQRPPEEAAHAVRGQFCLGRRVGAVLPRDACWGNPGWSAGSSGARTREPTPSGPRKMCGSSGSGFCIVRIDGQGDATSCNSTRARGAVAHRSSVFVLVRSGPVSMRNPSAIQPQHCIQSVCQAAAFGEGVTAADGSSDSKPVLSPILAGMIEPVVMSA